MATRAVRMEPGKHVVSFKFDPHSLHVTEAVGNGAMMVLLLALLFILGRGVWLRRKAKAQQAG